MQSDYKYCPHCGEKIKAEAIKCRYCLSMLGGEENEDGAVLKKYSTDESTISKKPERSRLPSDRIQAGGIMFLRSLFDVSMKEMVTPKIIRFIYLIGLIVIGLGGIIAIMSSLFMIGTIGFAAFIGTLLTAVIGAFVAVIFLRIYLEIIILLFNIYDKLVEIKMSRSE